MSGVIGQRPERAPPRPPQRLIEAARHQALHLRLIQPQPHERVRRRRKLLHQPGPLADHRDQLLPGIGIPGGSPQQLSGPRAGRHPQRDQRPVAMRGEPGEQLAEPLIGDAARDPLGQPGPEQAGPLVAVGGHRVVMRARAPAPALPVQRERIHHRARPGLEVEIVELPQHALAMRRGRRGITTAWPRLASHRIRCPPLRRRRGNVSSRLPGGPAPFGPVARAAWLDCDLDPPAEVTSLAAGRLIPRHPDRPAEPEPPQQVHPIRPLCRRGPPSSLQVSQVNRDRPDNLTRRIDQPIRIPRTARRLKETSLRHDKARHIPMKIVLSGHDQGP